MVLMMAGSELDPVFDSLAPVIALTDAVWDRWMPLATMEKCVRKAQVEQRENARPWAAVKGPFGAAVATLARMQWTILEHDPFLWCMHDGRIVDPGRVCPHSMRILLNEAARAWQCQPWSGRNAPVRRAEQLPLSTHEQGYLRSVVVGGQWTQQRKHRAAKTLSSLCALCGSEEGSLIHRHFRCSTVQYGEPSNMLGPFHAAAESGALWTHESFAARALLPALRGRPPGYTVPYETRWTGDRSLFTGVIYGDGSAYEGHDADVCVAGWGLVANTSSSALGSPMSRIAVLLSRASTSVGVRAPRPAHQRGRICGATSGARLMSGAA